MRDVA